MRRTVPLRVAYIPEKNKDVQSAARRLSKWKLLSDSTTNELMHACSDAQAANEQLRVLRKSVEGKPIIAEFKPMS